MQTVSNAAVSYSVSEHCANQASSFRVFISIVVSVVSPDYIKMCPALCQQGEKTAGQ